MLVWVGARRIEAGLIRKAEALTADAEGLRCAICARDSVAHPGEGTLVVTAADIFGP